MGSDRTVGHVDPMYYDLVDGPVLAVTPKVASTTLQRYLKYKERYWQHELPLKPIVTLVREPLKRFRSAFRWTLEFGEKGVTKCYKTFVDNFLDQGPDMHTVSQYEWHSRDGVYLPNHVLKFEDTEIFQYLPKMNASEGDVDNPWYRLDEIKDYYEKDYELYGR